LNITNTYLYVANGGSMHVANIFCRQGHVVLGKPLYLNKSIINLYHCFIEGNLTLFNSSLTIVESYVENLTAIDSSVESFGKVLKCHVLTPNASIALHREHGELLMNELELEVVTPGVEVNLTIEVPWCVDNYTVIVLPNGTVINVKGCKLSLKLLAYTKKLKLMILHGWYDNSTGWILHIGGSLNATIKSFSIRPRIGVIANVSVDAPSGNYSIVTMLNVPKPTRIFVNGTDITGYVTSDLSKCGNFCWMYIAWNKTLYVKMKHASTLSTVVYDANLEFDAWLSDKTLYVYIYNPYDYTMNFLIKYIVYSGRNIVEQSQQNVSVSGLSDATFIYTIGVDKFDKVIVEVYDEFGQLLFTREIRVAKVFAIPWEIILAIVVIAVVITLVVMFLRGGKKTLETRRTKYVR